MANNRELLKEALADAKSLREMAITNAKAALEESFTPQIKSMFSERLQEMEDLEEDDLYEMKDDQEKVEEDLNLEEILAELEEADDSEEVENLEVDEDDESEEAEEGDAEGEEDDKSIDVSDMSENDLKDFIESIISDMVKDGELPVDGEVEEEDMEDEIEVEDGEEVEDEDSIDIDELLAEIEQEEIEEVGFGKASTDGEEGFSSMGEKALDEVDMEDEEELEEGKLGDWLNKTFSINSLGKSWLKKNDSEVEKLKSNPSDTRGLNALLVKFKNEMEPEYATSKIYTSDRNAIRSYITGQESGGRVTHTAESKLSKSVEKDLFEALKANKVLKRELNEINLLNAKLLYTNRIFKAKNLTEGQKVKVLSTFDKATNVNEVELVYETLNGTFNTKKKSINENLGSASRTMGTTKTTKPIIEVNDAYRRMQEIAFYDVKH